MYRQTRRRISRYWKKVKCFTICTGKVPLDENPYIAVDTAIKINDDILLRFCLSVYGQWWLFPIDFVGGFFIQDFHLRVGVVSEELLDKVFGDDDFEVLARAKTDGFVEKT